MKSFSEALALVGLKPKTLTDATAAIDTSKATLDSVNALFTAAGLPLEPLLAAGPDSLKAHLAGLSAKDGELAAALAKVNELTASLTAKTADFTAQLTAKETAHASALAGKVAELTTATATLGTATGFLAEIGFKPAPEAKAEALKPLWKAHVAKATTLQMATLGIPERFIPKAIEETAATATDEAVAKEYSALPRGEAKQAFYAKHEQALWRHERAKQNAPE